MSEKPPKIPYENQERVFEEARAHLVELVKDKPAVNEALIWASLAEGKFGLYQEEYKGREGSDIDLVVILDENEEIPEEWGFTGSAHDHFDLYYLGKYDHEGHLHPIDGLLVSPSKHPMNEVREMLADRCKSIYLKPGQESILDQFPYPAEKDKAKTK